MNFRFSLFSLVTLVASALSLDCLAAPAFFRFAHTYEILPAVIKYLPDDPVILDAGAYDGNESAKMAMLWPKGTVHAFEPVPYLYNILLKRSKSVSNMMVYNFALSYSNGIADMHLSVADYAPDIPVMSSSLLPPKDHYIYSPETIFPTVIPVFTYNLDKWAKAFNIDRIDLMWLDMQGVELNVLKAAPEILNTTLVILTEVEFTESYEGQYLYQDVRTFLEDEGFVLIGGNFDPENPRGNGSYFGDGLFVRNWLLETN